MGDTVYIYGLVCPISGIVMYVGKAKDVKSRTSKHFSMARKGERTAKGKWLRELMRNNLLPSVVTLEECAKEEWATRECHWIDYCRSINPLLTNSQSGGSGGREKPRVDGEVVSIKPTNNNNVVHLRLEGKTSKEIAAFAKKTYGYRNVSEFLRNAIEYIIETRPPLGKLYQPTV